MLKRTISSISVLLTVLLIYSCCTFFDFSKKCESISDRVIRLHVLADSDSSEDQRLKLAVRDRILSEASAMLDVSSLSKEEAHERVCELLPDLTKIAEDEIRTQGSDLPVRLELTDTYFTTRNYGAYTLPAGYYDALRIVIGSGEGQNWWCIVFPPLCLSASTEVAAPQVELDAILSEDEMEIVSNYSQYQVKFKLVEWICNLREMFSRK